MFRNLDENRLKLRHHRANVSNVDMLVVQC